MHLVAVNSEVPLRLPTTFDHDLQPLSLCRTSAAAARIPLHVVRTRKWHRGGPSRIRSPNCFKGVPYLSAAGKIRNRHLPRMYILMPIESSLLYVQCTLRVTKPVHPSHPKNKLIDAR